MQRDREPGSCTQATWQLVEQGADKSTERYALFVADARDVLSNLPPSSIDTCLTSPPYWGARDYGRHDQIGLETEVEEYVANIVAVMQSVRRVLGDHGTVWLNLGDTYDNTATTVDGKPPATGWRRKKQLALVPFRVALALEDDGWWLRNVVIWHKPNAMPSSVRDRLTVSVHAA
jgi:site-specific DNA-methyltransferase (cytosine-N4-specific)